MLAPITAYVLASKNPLIEISFRELANERTHTRLQFQRNRPASIRNKIVILGLEKAVSIEIRLFQQTKKHLNKKILTNKIRIPRKAVDVSK